MTSKIFYSKPFLSYPAQLSLLKSRGMSFDDDAKALHLLERIGYYRLNGYWYPLLAEVFQFTASFVYHLGSNIVWRSFSLVSQSEIEQGKTRNF